MEMTRVSNNDEAGKPGKALIKEQLRRSFQDKASEDLPADLKTLIEKLREQDEQNGK
jgi:hypothetical protein